MTIKDIMNDEVHMVMPQDIWKNSIHNGKQETQRCLLSRREAISRIYR